MSIEFHGRSIQRRLILLGACALLLASKPAAAHNGAVVVAQPVKGIKIDGDLGDWLTSMPTVPITGAKGAKVGDEPNGEKDLNAHYRIGFDADEHALYIAVEVTDESTVIDNSPGATWNTQDGCELYIDAEHRKDGSPVAQYARYGDGNQAFGPGAALEDVEVAAVRSGSKRVYEWRVDLGDEFVLGRSLGFDVSVSDKDGDGSFSWAAWGPGTQKIVYPTRCGDVLLLDPKTRFGGVAGKIEWRTPSEAPLPKQVRIQSREVPNLWIGAAVDPKGAYAAKLPAGTYSIDAADTFEVRIDETSHVDVAVEADGHAKADLLRVTPLAKPDLIGRTGVLHRFETVDPQEIDRFIQAYMKYYKIPGLSIALIKDSKVVYHRGFGVKTAGTEGKVEGTTVFEAASMTKPVFSFAVNRLVERGVLDLDTPLYEYLPYADIAYDERYKLITARMVLCHRTGFPNWRSGKLDIKFDPGTKFGYSGEGFEYLGKVVSHLTGKELVDVIAEEVFAPLGMRNAYLTWSEENNSLFATPHRNGGLPLPKRAWRHPMMAASLHIDARNYAKFLIGILQEVGLAKATFKEMLRPQAETPENSDDPTFGLGISVDESPYGTEYGHGGSNNGFTSNSVMFKDRRMGYVFLVNNQQAHNLDKDLRAYLITGKEGAEAAADE